MNGGAASVRVARAVPRLVRTIVSDPRLVAELAVWRLSLPVLKRVVSVRRLAQRMWVEPRNGGAEAVAHVREVVLSSGRLLVSRNCLERSLVLYRLLSRAGANPRMVMGARRDEALAGHVWVEIDGQPLGEPEADRYLPILAFDARGAEHSFGAPAA